jgi:CheY-like chemotaxis protein
VPVSPQILVVDDEIISREAICSAIERADLRPVSVDDPIVAQGILEKTRFDLIFLDVEMPGQNGLVLCSHIRKMATNRSTPVVFVTAHSDFERRARSVLSGGNDFIAKPFLPIELAVKALIWTFKDKVPPVSAPDLKSSLDKEIGQRQAIEVLPGHAQPACANDKDQTLAVPVAKS